MMTKNPISVPLKSVERKKRKLFRLIIIFPTNFELTKFDEYFIIYRTFIVDIVTIEFLVSKSFLLFTRTRWLL